MNVLPYIFAILTALSLLTYSRYQSYVDERAFDFQMRREIQIDLERGKHLNQSEKSYFLSSPGKAASQESESVSFEEELSEQIDRKNYLSSRLDLRSLFSKETKAETAFVREFLTKLIDQVYGKQEFFSELDSKYGFLAQRLVDELISKSRGIDGEVLVISDSSFRSIDFQDSDLQRLWYRMMRGSGLTDGTRAYPSLESLVGINKSHQVSEPICIYLAEPKVLDVLFEDTIFVDQLLSFRKSISGGGEEAEKKLQDWVEQHPQGRVYKAFLNYQVSSTRPSMRK
ncbi:MAG: hypothetical protein CMO81_04565 [Waddliaceae bacterium]|nr:hypothetical protein [Waddliaceae bacterium]